MRADETCATHGNNTPQAYGNYAKLNMEGLLISQGSEATGHCRSDRKV